jgi:hypothetical protein
MKNKTVKIIAALLVLGLAGSLVGCKLLQMKVIEVVLKETTCMEFREREDSANFNTPETVDVADQIDDALASQEMTRADIRDARLLAGSYEVTWLEDAGHDWLISGNILIQRDDIADGPEIIVDYTNQSLETAEVEGEIFADLNPAGVALFNRALEDYVAGFDPVLTFTVSNDACTPAPSPADSLKFDWTGCMYMYLIFKKDLEVFDPS